jgi:hypothetical protein
MFWCFLLWRCVLLHVSCVSWSCFTDRFIYWSIYLLIDLSIYRFIHQFIDLFIHRFFLMRPGVLCFRLPALLGITFRNFSLALPLCFVLSFLCFHHPFPPHFNCLVVWHSAHIYRLTNVSALQCFSKYSIDLTDANVTPVCATQPSTSI